MKQKNSKECHPEATAEGSCHTGATSFKTLRAKSLSMTGEIGRTMVEMLGVLAIIGILSIGGIMGFRYAMNKHYANETVDRLTKRAVMISSQRLLGQNANLDDFDPNDGKFPIMLETITDNESFSLLVNEVPQEVCQKIVQMDWFTPKMIPEDCSDTSLKFKFLNDLTDCTDCVADSVDCSQYGTECGTCSQVRGYTRNDNDCVGSENGAYCILGHCALCEPGQTVYNNNCKACSAINYLRMSINDCHMCVDADNKPTHFFRGQFVCDKCTDTQDSSAGGTTIEECRRCSNRCLKGTQCGIAGVVNKYIDLTNYKRDADGYCDCTEGAFWANGGSDIQHGWCVTCSQLTTSKFTTLEGCHSCVNDQNQPTHFMRGSGNVSVCDPCDDTGDSFAGGTTIEECRRCSNRCLKGTQCGIPGTANRWADFTNYERGVDGYCILKE